MLSQLRIVFRTLARNRTYFVLNVLGLTTGLVVFLLIVLYVRFEFSFDNYHEKKDRIFRVYKENAGSGYQGSNRYAVIPAPLAAAMVVEFPEVEAAATLDREPNRLIRAGGRIFMEENVHSADPSVFDIFSFDLLAGDKRELLASERSAVISETTARKYFDRVDVVGETLRFRDETDFTIAGVIGDMPLNSHFRMDIMLNFTGVMKASDRRMDQWDNSSYYCFILLKNGSDVQDLQAKLPQLRAKYADDPIDEDGQESYYHLQALSDVHFTERVNFDIAPSASADDLYLYLGIAIVILFIASINYLNLSTARTVNRTKEIGIRKVIGAQRLTLVRAFLMESAVIVGASLLLAIITTWSIVPFFSDFLGKELPIEWSSAILWVSLVMLAAIVTLLSGLYPAWVTSRFQVVASLKGRRVSAGSSGFRNALVVFQFAVSCALILGAMVLNDQLSYIRTMDRGFVKDKILITYLRDDKIRDNVQVFKEALLKIPGIVKVSSSNSLPNNISSRSSVQWPGRPDEVDIPLYTNVVDYDFVDLYGLEMVEERGFDPKLDGRGAVLLNESAVEALGWDHPLGSQLIDWFRDTVRVVGVLRDFHQHSLHLEIAPTQFFLRDEGRRMLSIRMEGENTETVMAEIEDVYESFDPTFPFDFQYFDDIFDKAYHSEIKTARLAEWFTGIAALIACLGLYGLAAHQVQRRLKEVGIRKVLGASVVKILVLLTRDFGLLLAVSFVIAAPVSWHLMQQWLEGFAYHIDIDWRSLVAAFFVMMAIAATTVAYRTIRVAIRNPVEALHEE